MTIAQLEDRAKFLRTNVHLRPESADNLLRSADLYEKAARRKRRWRMAGVAAVPTALSGLFLAPSLFTTWADVSAEMVLLGVGCPLAVVAWSLHAKWFLTWLEARRPQHESARVAEMQDRRDRAPAPPRRQAPIIIPPAFDADGRVMEGGYPNPPRRPQPVGRVIEGEVA